VKEVNNHQIAYLSIYLNFSEYKSLIPQQVRTFLMTQTHTILLVDDEKILRDAVKEILEVNGFNVIDAADGDGDEALAWLAQDNIDLVITDLVMPNMDGVELVQKIRTRYQQLPIVVVSGSGTAVTKRFGFESINISGATASIAKPFKSTVLIALVKNLLDK
jgi:DNA-binding response OmpR family regulator